MKICSKCKLWLDESDFFKNTNQKDNNKDYTLTYETKKRSQDPLFKLRGNIRARTRAALKGTGIKSSIKFLGCSINLLKSHLESKFQAGMSWENYGKWHIDHIKPLAKFNLTNHEEVKKACHYGNLQPLWALDNFKKGARYEAGA